MVQRFTIPFLIAICCGSFSPAFGQFNIDDDFTQDTTLVAGTYVVSDTGDVFERDSTINVTNGATLILSPGVIIKFMSERSLHVQAGSAIEAEGTEANQIQFTSVEDGDPDPAAGDWGSIVLLGDYDLNEEKRIPAMGTFENCVFEYGGDNESGTLVAGPVVAGGYADLDIQNCLIQHCLGSGIGVQHIPHHNTLRAESNTIVNCENGIRIGDQNIDDNMSIINNVIVGMQGYDNGVTILHGYGIDIYYAEEEQQSETIELKNNIIAHCYSDGIHVIGEQYNPVVKILNNTITHSGDNGIALLEDATNEIYKNNLVYGYDLNDNGSYGYYGVNGVSVAYNYVCNYDTDDDDYNATITHSDDYPTAGQLPEFLLDNTSLNNPDPDQINWFPAVSCGYKDLSEYQSLPNVRDAISLQFTIRLLRRYPSSQ
ncbi:right-handed parallel beta-helix repeat-containing protein [bacterium]|nr:right-handed parallel beta-helix repeat-containing protein [bacterium]